MKFRFILFLVVFLVNLHSFTKAQNIMWSRTYGDSSEDVGESVQQTTDGGYIVTGYTDSFGAGGKDVYLIKTSPLGNTIWSRTYGGSSTDYGYSVQQTSDGGYIVVGHTDSFGAGGEDVYLIKTDSLGDTLWSRTYGGNSDDYGYSVQQTSDGEYIVAGETESFGFGSNDIYLIKIDSLGDTLWSRTYGGIGYDRGYSVQQTTDGGYIVSGYSTYYGAGYSAFYLIKTNSLGATLWSRTYGGISYDRGYSVQQTTDGGYIVVGYTDSFGAGFRDVYLIKTDSLGDTLWSRTYGGSSVDYGYSVQQTTDGGYIVTGYTDSFGAGSQDVYLIKTDSLGATLWSRTYGGIGYDRGYSVQQTTDGGYMVVGETESFGAGNAEIMLTKMDSMGNACIGEFVTSTVSSHSCFITIPVTFVNSPTSVITNPATGVTLPTTQVTNVCEVTSIKEDLSDNQVNIQRVDIVTLYQNYPNPFNLETNIQYRLKKAARINLCVYNIMGQRVRVLADEFQIAGMKSVTWNGKDSSGRTVASGIYVYKLKTDKYVVSKKMLLLK